MKHKEWSKIEITVVQAYVYLIKHNIISTYRACQMMRRILPNRTWEALRSRLRKEKNKQCQPKVQSSMD